LHAAWTEVEGRLLYVVPMTASRFVIVCMLTAAAGTACHRDSRAASRAAFARAEQYAGAGDDGAAIIEYRNAIQLDSQFGDAYNTLSLAYSRTRNATEAFRASVRAADLFPNNVDIQLRAIEFLLKARQFDDVRARAQAVLKLDPRNVRAELALG